MRRAWLLVTALTLLGAALRLAGIDAKGFWGDERSTVLVLRHAFFELPSALVHEANPPLYHLLAWPLQQAFGYGEVAARALPAIAGTATIPAAFLAGRELVSRRAALFVTALVAVNPFLVWFSQEARSYALATLFTTLGLCFFARTLRGGSRRDLLVWGGASALALCSHYYAGFVVAAEAVWLVRARGFRGALPGIALPVAAVLVLLPLVVAQYRDTGGSEYFEAGSLLARLVQVPAFFLVGFELPVPEAFIAAGVAAALAVAGIVLVRRAPPRDRRGALVAAVLALAVVLVPFALAVVGPEVFLYRYCIAAVVPAAIVVGAGFAAGGRLGLVAAASLCALSVGVVVATADTPKFQQDAWRDVADAIGARGFDSAIVATPGSPKSAPKTLQVYLPDLVLVEQKSVAVASVDVVALPDRDPGAIENPRLPDPAGREPPPGFKTVARRRYEHFLLIRYRSPRPRRLTAVQLRSLAVGENPAVLAPSRDAPEIPPID